MKVRKAGDVLKVSHEETEFWAMRSQKYNKLEWANKSDYLREFLDAGHFSSQDEVLDVGTGTGIIAHTVAPHVKKVTGIDISEEMIRQADDPKYPNIEWFQMDTHQLEFPDAAFDKLTARMVFHHVTTDTQKGMAECFRVLKNGGVMVFSEGVPPTPHVVPFYTEMFKLKEDRITFMEEDLEALMTGAGFKKIQKKIYWARQASIKNWLENSGIPQENQDKIFQMHLDLDLQGKKDYNMEIRNGDCFIDMKFVILAGTK